MRRIRNQSGFSFVELFLLLIIAGIITGVGYYVWSANKNTEQTLANIAGSEVKTGPTAKVNDSKKTGIFENRKLGLKFSYPEKWGTLNEAGAVTIEDKAKFALGFGDGPHKLTWDERDETMYFAQYEDEKLLPNTKQVVTTNSTLEHTGARLAAANNITKIYHIEGKGSFNCGTNYLVFPVKNKIVTISVAGCGNPAEDDPEQMAGAGDVYRFSDLDKDIPALLASIEITL